MLLDVAMKAFCINDIDKHWVCLKTFTLCVAICKVHFVIKNKMCKNYCACMDEYFYSICNFFMMRFNIIFFVHLSKNPSTLFWLLNDIVFIQCFFISSLWLICHFIIEIFSLGLTLCLEVYALELPYVQCELIESNLKKIDCPFLICLYLVFLWKMCSSLIKY
jgi:hypothetical protein